MGDALVGKDMEHDDEDGEDGSDLPIAGCHAQFFSKRFDQKILQDKYSNCQQYVDYDQHFLTRPVFEKENIGQADATHYANACEENQILACAIFFLRTPNEHACENGKIAKECCTGSTGQEPQTLNSLYHSIWFNRVQDTRGTVT
jgi:hypothetical protein